VVQRHPPKKNIDLLFVFEDVNEEKENGKEDKLRDGYWFHLVQIESSSVPSASDFKGL
jgi:hypothetical protein